MKYIGIAGIWIGVGLSSQALGFFTLFAFYFAALGTAAILDES
jgi:hypothetical protein